MIDELAFGKEGSKFLVKQNISLDDLIEGKQIKREYELVIYNTLAPVSGFPELNLYSWIKNEKLEGIIRLTPEISKIEIPAKDFLEVMIAGGGGATIGSLIGKEFGAIIGAILGGALAKIIPEKYDRFLKKWQKKYGAKKTEIITGSCLKSLSKGTIPIDDGSKAYFGIYNYTNKFTKAEDYRTNMKTEKHIKELIENEKEKIKSIPGCALDKRMCLSILEEFELAFDKSPELVYLYNKIEVGSVYRKDPKTGIITKCLTLCDLIEKTMKERFKPKEDVRLMVEKVLLRTLGRYTKIGDIVIKLGKDALVSGEETKKQFKKALYAQKYHLENSLSIDLKDIIKQKKDEIIYAYEDKIRQNAILQKEYKIPYGVVDRLNRINFFGILYTDLTMSKIIRGHYYHENKIYEI